MGYSFSTPCKSERARDLMLSFLNAHYRSWAQVFSEENTSISGPITDLSYDDSKCKIGFDYRSSLSDSERTWVDNFCYWMALRVGRRRRFSKRLPGIESVPYVLYDGHEAWPVLERAEYQGKIPADEEWALVDNGFRGAERKVLDLWELHCQRMMERGEVVPLEMPEWRLMQIQEAQKEDAIIKGELARLTDLWASGKETE